MNSLKLRITPWLFIMPALLMFTLFVVYPIISSIRLSFFEWDGLPGPQTFVGLQHYKEMFDPEIDYLFPTAIANNIKWLILFPLAIPIGLGLALFLNQKNLTTRIAKSLFFFPFVLSAAVVAVVFSWIYDPRFGILNDALSIFGVTNFAILENETWVTYGIIGAAIYPQIAYCLILYVTGLSNVNSEMIEAGRLDGAKGWKMLRYIVLPQLWPATFLAIVVTVIGALRSFDFIALMTGGGPYGSSTVLAYRMYKESLLNFRMGYGSAYATVLFMVMNVFIVYFIWKMVRDQKEDR